MVPEQAVLASFSVVCRGRLGVPSCRNRRFQGFRQQHKQQCAGKQADNKAEGQEEEEQGQASRRVQGARSAPQHPLVPAGATKAEGSHHRSQWDFQERHGSTSEAAKGSQAASVTDKKSINDPPPSSTKSLQQAWVMELSLQAVMTETLTDPFHVRVAKLEPALAAYFQFYHGQLTPASQAALKAQVRTLCDDSASAEARNVTSAALKTALLQQLFTARHDAKGSQIAARDDAEVKSMAVGSLDALARAPPAQSLMGVSGARASVKGRGTPAIPPHAVPGVAYREGAAPAAGRAGSGVAGLGSAADAGTVGHAPPPACRPRVRRSASRATITTALQMQVMTLKRRPRAHLARQPVSTARYMSFLQITGAGEAGAAMLMDMVAVSAAERGIVPAVLANAPVNAPDGHIRRNAPRATRGQLPARFHAAEHDVDYEATDEEQAAQALLQLGDT